MFQVGDKIRHKDCEGHALGVVIEVCPLDRRYQIKWGNAVRSSIQSIEYINEFFRKLTKLEQVLK